MRFLIFTLVLSFTLASQTLAKLRSPVSERAIARRGNCLNCFSGHSPTGSSPQRSSRSSSSHGSSPKPTKHPPGPFHSHTSSSTSSSRSHSSSSTPTSGDDRALMITPSGYSFRGAAPKLRLDWQKVRKQIQIGTSHPLPQRQHRPHSPSKLSPRPNVSKVEHLQFGSFRPSANGDHGNGKVISPPFTTNTHTSSTTLPALRIGGPHAHQADHKGKAVDKGKGKAIATHESSSSSDSSPERSRPHFKKSGHI